MQSLPLLPHTAPFAADQIAALNHVMKGTSPEQRAWLSGFLAGFQTASGGQAVAPAAPPTPKAALTILYATESGNSEALAGSVRKTATRLGFAPKVLDMANTNPADIAKVENLLVIASTWGEGEPPQRAVDFLRALLGPQAPRFTGVRFAVLALGDRAYANFCATGREIDERLAALGGTRLAERAECDVDYQQTAGSWIETTLQGFAPPAESAAIIHVDFARGLGEPAEQASRDAPFAAEITDMVNLNGSRSTARTLHVELSLAGSGISYEPGDAIGVVPENDPALVAEIQRAVGLEGDAASHTALREKLDITTLTRPQLDRYAALTGDATLAAIAADDAKAVAFLHGRQVIDLLTASPRHLTPEQLSGLLRPLQPRLYSVASSARLVPDQADLLVAAVDYQTHGRRRLGVASGDIGLRHKVGDRLKIYVKSNPHFRLPADPARDIVMIGPGTGVAPFRGFLQQREATGAAGKSWLFFGSRNYTQDFLYQLEWQDWLASGVLSRLDVAFSRDQPEKIYVQHRMWQRRRELFAWLQDGACLYVCGDAGAMARDVHAMLVAIAQDQGMKDGEAWVDGVRRDGRYLRDVY